MEVFCSLDKRCDQRFTDSFNKALGNTSIFFPQKKKYFFMHIYGDQQRTLYDHVCLYANIVPDISQVDCSILSEQMETGKQ